MFVGKNVLLQQTLRPQRVFWVGLLLSLTPKTWEPGRKLTITLSASMHINHLSSLIIKSRKNRVFGTIFENHLIFKSWVFMLKLVMKNYLSRKEGVRKI